MIKDIKLDVAKDQVMSFLSNMKKLGLNSDEIVEFVEKVAKEVE